MKNFQRRSWYLEFLRLYWRAALLALIMYFPVIKYAQAEDAFYKTNSGCRFYLDKNLINLSPHSFAQYSEWTWDGECLDGLAVGIGDLIRLDTSGPKKKKIQRVNQRTKMLQGKRFGFQITTIEYLESEITSRPSWSFLMGERIIASDGLGLEASNNLLDHKKEAGPIRTNGPFNYGYYLSDSQTGALQIHRSFCGREAERFPDCKEGEGKQDYEVFYLEQTPPNYDPKQPTRASQTWCPNPKDITSCSQLFSQLLDPVVRHVEAFIRASMPKVIEMDIAMQAALKKVTKAKELETRRLAEEAERPARELAANNAAFESKLDKAPVGELFALADEYKSKGDKARARATLRKLMGRFPDHKLAALAATMLTDMQGE